MIGDCIVVDDGTARFGNVPGHRYNSTFWSDTGERLIHRVNFTVV